MKKCLIRRRAKVIKEGVWAYNFDRTGKDGQYMATVIKMRTKRAQKLPSVFFEIFPIELCAKLLALADGGVPIDEVRIRSEREVSVTSCGRNLRVDHVTKRSEMDVMVDAICESSLYAHADTISNGYVTLSDGIRVGITGRASVDGEKIIGVYDVTSLSFRIPRRINRVGAPVCRLLRKNAPSRGVLIYSPPGQGKTTLLRSVTESMASGESPWRVLVIDSRGELGFALEGASLCLDVLYGYPRPIGIEIAARSMNAQLIVCDEIGTVAEAEAIIAAQNCGVPLLATAHAQSFEGLLRRTGIAMLHDVRIFGAYVGIERREGMTDYVYDVHEVEE